MSSGTRPLAVVTGASTGIGLELAKRCAEAGFDLVVVADEPAINDAAIELRGLGAAVNAVEVDLSTTEGVDKLYAAVGGRPVEGSSPTPAGASATASSTRISATSGTSWTPTPPARST